MCGYGGQHGEGAADIILRLACGIDAKNDFEQPPRIVMTPAIR
jgi:hypothetical protein